MQRRLLVAVDESLHARNASLYAAGFYLPASDFHLTLMHVQPNISQMLKDDAKNDPKLEMVLKAVQAMNKKNSQKILNDCRDALIGAGIQASCIDTVSRVRTLGLAKDILEYGRSHRFDAIVAGRRGLGRIQKVFMGSTSAKLMEHAGDIPLWIVDGQVRPERVLVAIDQRASSLPLIDHIGRMCAGMRHLHLIFFHVFDDLKMDDFAPSTPGADKIDKMIEKHKRDVIEDFWGQARNDLASFGLAEEQIEIKTVQRNSLTGDKTGKMIIHEIEKNPYDTVILGRTGSGLAYFFGNVSRYVSERLTGHAIWLIG